MPIKFRWPQDINAIRFGATLVWGVVNGIITTIQGTSPLSLVNAVAGRIKSLVQYGKCITVDDERYCNNGKLVAVDDELPAGYKRLLGITFDSNIRYETGEALTGDDDVTMTLDNLSSSGKNVFGSYNGANGKNFSLYIYGSASTGSYFRFGDQLKRPKYGTGKRTITFGKSGTSGFDSDSDVTPDEFTTPANVYIGMLPNSSSAAYAGDIIGSIIVSNRLEWIPCERESDGVIGYYEKYNGNFLEPVGSGLPVSLGYDTSHLTALSVVGTPEVLTVGEQTASVENLFAVDDIADEQNIISGTVTRRCEAVISDGTTPSGRYIGTVGEGNIIVKVRETGYEGDVATFEADRAKPLNGLTVNVEPIQDLHGYDSPWPAGGGKNLFDRSLMSNAESGAKYIDLTLNPNTTYTASSNDPMTSGAADIFFLLPGESVSTGANGVYNNRPVTKTTGADGIARIGYRAYNDLPISTLIGFETQVELGSTATSFAPYSNICPISGRTSTTVTRTGKNLLSSAIGRYNWAGGVRYINETGTYCATEDKVSICGGQTYIASFNNTGTTNAVYFAWFNGDTFLGNGSAYSAPWKDTAPTNADGVAISFRNANNYTGNPSVSNVQLELGSTASAYEPYQGNTVAVDWTTEAGTVYGGTIDVATGLLTVDMLSVDFGDLTWTKRDNITGGFSANPSPAMKSPTTYAERQTGFILSCYAADSQISVSDNMNNYKALRYDGGIYIKDTTYQSSTADDFKTAMSGVQLCYELATPIEITLTPTQIETLLGQNNVWSDAGSVKAYVADAELIEHVTAQPLRTAEGSNTVSVTSAVDPVQLEIDYYKDE